MALRTPERFKEIVDLYEFVYETNPLIFNKKFTELF